MFTHTPTKPAAGAADLVHGPRLLLRLSDGRTWAHEFEARSAYALRDGCFEAFVTCRLEWQRRADELPAHQTHKRAAVLAGMPRTLQLQFCDPATGHWLDANRATDPMRQLTVSEPGSAPGDAWEAAPWPDAWLRCLKTADAAHRLAVFLGQALPAMLADGLS